MINKYNAFFQILAENRSLLDHSLHGLEKECLRVSPEGVLSKLPHPAKLGSKLCHPYISTDFAEAQLEFITPPFSKEEGALGFLKDLHGFVYDNIEDELLWPYSTPCCLPEDKDISTADFGPSMTGQIKNIYRKGLLKRYSVKMQMLSGIHYNFSFSDDLWKELYKDGTTKEISFQDFRSENYLGLVRNYQRYSWICTYLYGASPISDQSFQKKKRPQATSLRMSSSGYHHKNQLAQITTNSFSDFIKQLENAVQTPSEEFSKIDPYSPNGRQQLNENIFQIPAEYYARIRPKAPMGNSDPLKSLKTHGITYVEARNIDLSPFHLAGIDITQLRFMHLLMVYCFCKESAPIEDNEITQLEALYERIALTGLDNDIENEISGILNDMKQIAKIMGSQYESALEIQLQKVSGTIKTPSQIIKESPEGHLRSGLKIATQLRNSEISDSHFSLRMKAIGEKSIKDQKELEYLDDLKLKDHEHLEVSTQALIREAWLRGVDVEIIDPYDNFILLKNRKQQEYIKQATKTRLDSYMTFLIMESKNITKHVLKKGSINTPDGKQYNNINNAIGDYKYFENRKIVIKPNSTNYGIGISFIEAHCKDEFIVAIAKAFKHSKQILVEDFFKGEEYRFLVIGKKVVASCNRMPAHVIGDGEKSIQQLVIDKNQSIKYNKIYHIKLNKTEKDLLTKNGLNISSIPSKGQRIFLRENSNVSTGGDSQDTSDIIHNSYNRIALEAANSAEAKICGVDMMIKDIKEPANKNNHTIIELNFNPILSIHRFPTYGKKRYVEKDLLDLLGF